MLKAVADRDRFFNGIRTGLFLLTIIPAIYVFVAIQYSAITVPFWDHTELIRWLSPWYDGTFTVPSLWAPHNHTRPLVYRAVMLFNAVLTGWDIRSEYVYMYAVIYGVFAVHLRAIRKLTDANTSLLTFPTSMLLISLLIFSPAGHNNHWWSMMFQLNAANLFIAFGLLTVFLNPQHWVSHILGLASCWFAAYSLTNGIFSIITVIIVLQLASNSFRPNGWALIWTFNLVILLMLYMPGMPTLTSPVHPSIGQLAWFSLTYLGTPLGSLLWFPFKSQFDIPISTIFNGLCGVTLFVSAGLLSWHARERLRNQHPAALILMGFVIFAGISALTTAWGRATFDSYGISNANASRYTIFGVYLILGQIYYISAGFAEGWWYAKLRKLGQWRRLMFSIVVGIALFVILSSISYIRAIPIYVEANNTNKMLAGAYEWGVEPTNFDQFIHPNPEFVRQLKSELQRLQLGPYSNPKVTTVTLPIGEYELSFPLFGNEVLAQRFRVNAPGLKALGVTMVTWENKQISYQIAWRLYDLSDNEKSLIEEGAFDSLKISDWQTIWLQLPYMPDSNGRLYEIEFTAQGGSDEKHVIGFPLYSLLGNQADIESVVITNKSITEPLALGLSLKYIK